MEIRLNKFIFAMGGQCLDCVPFFKEQIDQLLKDKFEAESLILSAENDWWFFGQIDTCMCVFLCGRLDLCTHTNCIVCKKCEHVCIICINLSFIRDIVIVLYCTCGVSVPFPYVSLTSSCWMYMKRAKAFAFKLLYKCPGITSIRSSLTMHFHTATNHCFQARESIYL